VRRLPPVALPPVRRLAPALLDWEDDAEREAITKIAAPGAAAALAPGAPPARRSKLVILVGGALLAAVVVLTLALVLSKGGTLIVTVSGPGGAAVEGVRVMIDGVLRCEESPCRADELGAGAHTVRVEAAGYIQPADRAIAIESGGDAVLDFTLAQDEVKRTGLRVGTLAQGARLFVDGKDRGTLPATVDGLEPGEHSVRIAGGARYEDWEKKLTLDEGDFEELKPELVAKRATLKLRGDRTAKGAEILLICGDEQELILDLPKDVQVGLDKDCRIQASREKHEPFAADVTFGENETKKTMWISLEKEDPRKKKRRAAGGDKAKPPAGQGRISINSIPQSSVIVDGRPVGRTPTQVTVPEGRHSVLFMHPEKGRRARTVTVRAGKTAVAAVKF
jgi:hypothetical protein